MMKNLEAGGKISAETQGNTGAQEMFECIREIRRSYIMALTESRSLPPKFVEDLGKDYATQLTGLTSQKLDTTKFQPMVAGQDQAQTDAYNLATTQGQGIGAFAPYLTQAGAYGTAAAGLSGPQLVIQVSCHPINKM